MGQIVNHTFVNFPSAQHVQPVIRKAVTGNMASAPLAVRDDGGENLMLTRADQR